MAYIRGIQLEEILYLSLSERFIVRICFPISLMTISRNCRLHAQTPILYILHCALILTLTIQFLPYITLSLYCRSRLHLHLDNIYLLELNLTYEPHYKETSLILQLNLLEHQQEIYTKRLRRFPPPKRLNIIIFSKVSTVTNSKLIRDYDFNNFETMFSDKLIGINQYFPLYCVLTSISDVRTAVTNLRAGPKQLMEVNLYC